jgi:hypothetical protein
MKFYPKFTFRKAKSTGGGELRANPRLKNELRSTIALQ